MRSAPACARLCGTVVGGSARGSANTSLGIQTDPAEFEIRQAAQLQPGPAPAPSLPRAASRLKPNLQKRKQNQEVAMAAWSPVPRFSLSWPDPASWSEAGASSSPVGVLGAGRGGEGGGGGGRAWASSGAALRARRVSRGPEGSDAGSSAAAVRAAHSSAWPPVHTKHTRCIPVGGRRRGGLRDRGGEVDGRAAQRGAAHQQTPSLRARPAHAYHIKHARTRQSGARVKEAIVHVRASTRRKKKQTHI